MRECVVLLDMHAFDTADFTFNILFHFICPQNPAKKGNFPCFNTIYVCLPAIGTNSRSVLDIMLHDDHYHRRKPSE